jgi:hypothetical protein
LYVKISNIDVVIVGIVFVDSIHNVAPQEVVNLWHIKESKTNVGIWSFTRYVTFKNWDEF